MKTSSKDREAKMVVASWKKLPEKGLKSVGLGRYCCCCCCHWAIYPNDEKNDCWGGGAVAGDCDGDGAQRKMNGGDDDFVIAGSYHWRAGKNHWFL